VDSGRGAATPADSIRTGPVVDTSKMRTIPFDDNSAGASVRLERNGATVTVQRWPGPHGAGQMIHLSGGSCFCFERFDATADGGPEAIYRWASTA
jgi:hypothetical protein